jgi:hypothetical protein
LDEEDEVECPKMTYFVHIFQLLFVVVAEVVVVENHEMISASPVVVENYEMIPASPAVAVENHEMISSSPYYYSYYYCYYLKVVEHSTSPS